jgi:cytochrome c-type biogenesis protein CcmF
MIPELGHFALILALCVAAVQGTLPIAGAARGQAAWMALARPAALAQFGLVAIAFGCLAQAFLGNDFSVAYVVANSNTRLPAAYRFAGIWGGHEGSILLWAFILAAWSVGVAAFSRHLPERMVARVLGVMGLLSVGFLVFILFSSNPFERILPAALDGRDLNPLLQDPGMVFHPPLLYLGYVGFSVAFAFAIAALLDGRLDATWARWSRPWTIAAWSFLTLGIMLGSFWAYYELGWGGWWFWDPVENASFMPWLVGTALLHSLAVAEKRGSFKAWTALLAILAFSLSLLGTFLVRSGVLSSVHAFATDPKRGVFILTFLAIVIGASLLLFALRAHRVGLGGKFELVSRESMLLGNNVVLMVVASAVMLGTLYPLALDALGLGKISVGPPYFETVFVPLMAVAILLLGIGPLAKWKQDSIREIGLKLRWPALGTLALAAAAPFLFGRWSPMVFLGLLLGFWIVATSFAGLRLRLAGAGGLPARLRAQPQAYYGMLCAHLGVAVFILGVTVAKGYESETDVKMTLGESTQLAGYTFRLSALADARGPNYEAVRATVDVLKDSEQVATLFPEKRFYVVQKMPMTEAALDVGFLRHLYVSLGEPVAASTWTLRIYVKPLVGWIWGGCLLMALGGALAALDRRYRFSTRSRAAAPATVSNGAIYAEQLAQLDAELRAGRISPEQWSASRIEIERRALDEAGEARVALPARRSWVTVTAIGVAVPLVAISLYAALGTPRALSPGAGRDSAAQRAPTPEQINAMLAKLVERLKSNPGDTEGWIMLGRSYTVLGHYPNAAAAYAQAAGQRPDDSQLLADYAEVLAIARGRNLAGEPEMLIARALKADGSNLKALTLAGTVAFQRQDYRRAIGHWERILPLATEDSAFAKSVRISIAEAETRLQSGSASNATKRVAGREPVKVNRREGTP